MKPISQVASSLPSRSSTASPDPSATHPPTTETCPRCADQGYIKFARLPGGSEYELPPNTSDIAIYSEQPKAIISYAMCPCVKRKQAEVRFSAQQAAVKQLFADAGIPSIHRISTFESWDALASDERAGKESARAYAERFAQFDFTRCNPDRIPPKPSLVLSGQYGLGKSGLAAAVANARLRDELPILWRNFNQLINDIRHTYGKDRTVTYRQVIAAVQDAPFLILDDMGDARASRPVSDDLRRNVWDFIQVRADELRPVLITTNLDRERFRWMFGDRIADRVEYMSEWFDLHGANLRFEE